MKNLLLASLFALSLPVAVFAQTSGTGSMANPTASLGSKSSASTMIGKLSDTDKKFIHSAAIAGLAEVQDGQLAGEKGNDSVKQIGSQMVTDHTKANDKLAALSQHLGDPAPTQTDAMHMQMSALLKTKSGSAFDTAYLHTELLGHEKTIALFKQEASNGSNPQLMAFAKSTLPILEEHLSMIKNDQKS